MASPIDGYLAALLQRRDEVVDAMGYTQVLFAGVTVSKRSLKRYHGKVCAYIHACETFTEMVSSGDEHQIVQANYVLNIRLPQMEKTLNFDWKHSDAWDADSDTLP